MNLSKSPLGRALFKNNALRCFAVLSISMFCATVGAQNAPQDEVPLAPKVSDSRELYRVRVENMLQGSVSLSADGGARYTLIGRVTHPAAAVMVEKAANTAGVVLRSGGEGLALAINLGQALKLRPGPASIANGKRSAPQASPEPGTILTNIAPRSGIFGDLAPPPGSQVKIESDPRALRPFPSLYEPSEDDAIVIVVEGKTKQAESEPIPDPQHPTPNTLPDRIAALGQAYRAKALTRARQEHRPIISGMLSLKATLPQGEPDPIAYVTYAIDNRTVSSQNISPFNFDWDTRQAADGEHLVEVRALNRNGHVITSKRTLVVVQNKGS